MSNSLVPPSSGVKKERAKRVFGDALDDELDYSLSYSLGSDSSIRSSDLTLKKLDDPKDDRWSTSSLESTSYSLDTATGVEPDKENKSNNSHLAKVTSPLSAPKSNALMRSPLNKDLLQKTQEAINKATVSVNRSLNAARRAKKISDVRKSREIQNFRREWQDAAEEAKSFHQEAEQSRQQILKLHRQLSSKFSKEKARRHMLSRQNSLQTIEEESQFNSAVYREHQLALREEEERRRRMSIEARSKLRQNHRQGEQLLKLREIQEEEVIHEEKREASLALRKFQSKRAEERRKSFSFRNGDARRIRELFAKLEAEKQQKEEEIFELERLAHRDMEEYQQAEAKARRESLASRNEQARKQRMEESERQQKQAEDEHLGFELKWEAERDAELSRKKLAEARRNSLALRNEESSRQRREASEKSDLESKARHEDYELKWAAERDAEEYIRAQEKARRESLANRNKHARDIREATLAMEMEEAKSEHDSYELKWAGEKDAEAHKRELEKQRRESLAARIRYKKQQSDFERELAEKAMAEEHKSFELRMAAEKDADAYKRHLAEERRKSLAARNAEGFEQQKREKQRLFAQMVEEHESYELKWAAEKDVEEYRKKMAEERRQSLARRNKESAQHAKVMNELRTLALDKERESYVLKWAGEEDAKKYLEKQAEERRLSLQQRGKQFVHGRQVEEQQANENLSKLQEDEKLRSFAQKDVERYRKECQDRDRASLQYRQKEARIKRLKEVEIEKEHRGTEAANFELETLARGDVAEYVAECRNRRRLSLAFRAKEKRKHAQWQRDRANQEREQYSKEVRARLMDQRSVELARQQERAKAVLDALRLQPK